MTLLYILLGIVALIYLFIGGITIKMLNDELKKGTPITLVQKRGDAIIYLYFPILIPFVIISKIKWRKIKKQHKINKEIIKQAYLGETEKDIEDFENYIKSRCGVFDICFYTILLDMKNSGREDHDYAYNLTYNTINENYIKIDSGKINQLSYDLLHLCLRRKYNETNDQLAIRLRKAGYKVRFEKFIKDESIHIKCNFAGKEAECPKSCNSCEIKLKEQADTFVESNPKEAIRLYTLTIAKEPKYAEAWNNLGDTYYKLGDFNNSLKSYLKAISIDKSYGDALWGSAKSLSSLGRYGEAMSMLNKLSEYYDVEEANNALLQMKKNKVQPVDVNANQEEYCKKQILLIAKTFEITHLDNFKTNSNISILYESLFNSFYDYLIDYFHGNIERKKIIKLNCEFMMLAGMAATKLWNKDNFIFENRSLTEVLTSSKGFFAMDEYCCDILSIPYVPDKGNAISNCTSTMVETAITSFASTLNQIKELKHLKYAVHDMSRCFYELGISFIEERIENNDESVIKTKELTKKDMLKARLIAMERDPKMKTEKRSSGAMCYSIAEPELELYRCSHCGKTYRDYPTSNCTRYYDALKKLGVDCILEKWCRECCLKNNIQISNYSKSEYILMLRIEQTEPYRLSKVSSYDLEVLYQFFKNENKFDAGMSGTSFVGEHSDIVKRILGI